MILGVTFQAYCNLAAETELEFRVRVPEAEVPWAAHQAQSVLSQGPQSMRTSDQ